MIACTIPASERNQTRLRHIHSTTNRLDSGEAYFQRKKNLNFNVQMMMMMTPMQQPDKNLKKKRNFLTLLPHQLYLTHTCISPCARFDIGDVAESHNHNEYSCNVLYCHFGRDVKVHSVRCTAAWCYFWEIHTSSIPLRKFIANVAKTLLRVLSSCDFARVILVRSRFSYL